MDMSSSIRWHGIEPIFEQEFLNTSTHDEIEKILRGVTRCIPAGPHHRLPELYWRKPSGRRFINDTHLPAVDGISAVDDPHICSPCADQVHDVITVLPMQKTGPVFIRGVEFGKSPGRDFTQC